MEQMLPGLKPACDQLACEVHLKTPREIDVVFSGGAFTGTAYIGAMHVLRQVEALTVRRYAGSSVGAWVAVHSAVGMDMDVQRRIYMDMHHAFVTSKCWKVNPSLVLRQRDALEKLLPADAYRICSGRCFLSITVLRRGIPQNVIISQFASNADLVNACLASSSIPMLTSPFGFRFRGELVVDGGATNNTPCFLDGVRDQLVFDLTVMQRFQPISYMLAPLDPCIDAFIMRGAVCMASFLQGRNADGFVAWNSPGGSSMFKQTIANLLRAVGIQL